MNRWPVTRLIRTARGHLPHIRLVSYTSAFRRLSVPAGTLVFTDFDLLSAFERDAAGALSVAAERRGFRVLNTPARVMERFALLSNLHRAGKSPIEVTRLEAGDRPSRFPLFLRLEDGCLRPDTGLISDQAGLEAALSDLAAAGKSLKGRIAVSFENRRDADGQFRKYGAFCIGGQVVPQHVLRGPDWIVKSNRAAASASFAAEELAWVRDNPHADRIREIFEFAGIDFGRLDYTVIDGRVVPYEINTNPTFPRFRGGDATREERRAPILNGLAAAFAAIDTPGASGRITFRPDPAGARYIKRRRWGWATRQLWKLRMARHGKTEDD